MLTRQWKALPPHCSSPVHPLMVQLVMNRNTKGYEVVFMYCKTERGAPGDIKTKVYNSATGEWLNAKSSSSTILLGYQHRWAVDDYFELLDFSRCSRSLYDSDGFKALDPTPVQGASVRGHALVGDHLFVLHEDMGEGRDRSGEVEHQNRYFISEYRGQKSSNPNWVRVKDHSLTDLKYCLHREHFDDFDLFGCKGFLMVSNACESCGFAEVYDLSTGKCHVITDMPVFIPADLVVWDAGMCKLQWDAVP